MSIRRKGARRVTVDDREYLWTIRKKPTYAQAALECPMTIAVQACGEAARGVLVVNARISRPDNWIRPHRTPVTPAMVRQMVRSALESGWEPSGATGSFVHDHGVISRG